MNAKAVDVFEKYFPKTYERPGLQPYKEEIRDITMNIIKDMLGMNDRKRAIEIYEEAKGQSEMPYHKEL